MQLTKKEEKKKKKRKEKQMNPTTSPTPAKQKGCFARLLYCIQHGHEISLRVAFQIFLVVALTILVVSTTLFFTVVGIGALDRLTSDYMPNALTLISRELSLQTQRLLNDSMYDTSRVPIDLIRRAAAANESGNSTGGATPLWAAQLPEMGNNTLTVAWAVDLLRVHCARVLTSGASITSAHSVIFAAAIMVGCLQPPSLRSSATSTIGFVTSVAACQSSVTPRAVLFDATHLWGAPMTWSPLSNASLTNATNTIDARICEMPFDKSFYLAEFGFIPPTTTTSVLQSCTEGTVDCVTSQNMSQSTPPCFVCVRERIATSNATLENMQLLVIASHSGVTTPTVDEFVTILNITGGYFTTVELFSNDDRTWHVCPSHDTRRIWEQRSGVLPIGTDDQQTVLGWSSATGSFIPSATPSAVYSWPLKQTVCSSLVSRGVANQKNLSCSPLALPWELLLSDGSTIASTFSIRSSVVVVISFALAVAICIAGAVTLRVLLTPLSLLARLARRCAWFDETRVCEENHPPTTLKGCISSTQMFVLLQKLFVFKQILVEALGSSSVKARTQKRNNRR